MRINACKEQSQGFMGCFSIEIQSFSAFVCRLYYMLMYFLAMWCKWRNTRQVKDEALSLPSLKVISLLQRLQTHVFLPSLPHIFMPTRAHQKKWRRRKIMALMILLWSSRSYNLVYGHMQTQGQQEALGRKWEKGKTEMANLCEKFAIITPWNRRV